MAGSQKITLWGPQRTALGILRVKNEWSYTRTALHVFVWYTRTVALRYYSDNLGIDSRWCQSLGIFSVATDGTGSTQPLKMSTRNFSWGKGSRCVRLTTYHPSSAERQENPGP